MLADTPLRTHRDGMVPAIPLTAVDTGQALRDRALVRRHAPGAALPNLGRKVLGLVGRRHAGDERKAYRDYEVDAYPHRPTIAQSKAVRTLHRDGRHPRALGTMKWAAMHCRPRVVTAIVALLLVMPPARVRAGNIVVPDDHPTIQDAIAHAGPSDTIQIKPGTYAESIVIAGHGKDGLTLAGLGGRPRLTPPAGKDGIRVRGARHVTIRGLDVSGGRVGVHVLDAVHAVVTDVRISETAHGIRFRRCTDECEISRNNVQDATHGPGILVRDSPALNITGNVVTRSTREGIYVSRADELSMDDNVIEQSGADGIRITQCDAIDGIDSNIARGNIGSGLHLNHGYSHGTCSACGLTDNVAEGNRRYGFRVRRWARLASATDLSERGNTATGNQAADVRVLP